MVKVSKNSSGKIVYEVPSEISKHFSTIFEKIDNNKQMYGIKDYIVRNSTMEEVFIASRLEEEYCDSAIEIRE